MLQSRGFSAPKALLQKPLGATFSSTHPIERTSIIRASSIYTFHEKRAQCTGGQKIYTSKKAHSLLISIKTSRQGFFTTNSKTPILYENASSVHFSSAKTPPLGRRTAGNMSAIQQLCGSSSILLRKIVV